jgi:hypothetical protein
MAKEPEPIVIGGGFGGFIITAAVLFSIVIVAGLAQHQPPRDNSDPPGGRSNMSVLTDALTGCQYLATQRGGITPRMGADNKQVCN